MVTKKTMVRKFLQLQNKAMRINFKHNNDHPADALYHNKILKITDYAMLLLNCMFVKSVA